VERIRRSAAAALLVASLAVASATAQDTKPPEEPPKPVLTMDQIRGVRVEILSPPEKYEGTRSIVLVLHDHIGNGKDTVNRLAALAERGFIVVGPSSKSGGWTTPELETVKGIARDLFDRYGIPKERRHVAGHWTGAGDLGVLALDEGLGFRTGCWMNAAWPGGSIPKSAREGFAGLFLWGAKEGPSRVDRYRRGATSFAEKARVSVARGEPQEPGLGRSRSEDAVIPTSLLPFWAYFLECMEGRYVHGRDLAFDWTEDLEAARAAMGERKIGGLVYVWSKDADDAEKERTKALQNEVFFDHVVQHFGQQLAAVRLEKTAAKALLEQAKVTATPAIVVYAKGGKAILKSIAGDVTAKALVPLLRAAAPDPELPK
jgi:hypothetical protein